MASKGVWVAHDPAKVQAPLIESAAEKALWLAVERSMKVVFWPFGVSLDEAIAAGVVKPPSEPRKPKAVAK